MKEEENTIAKIRAKIGEKKNSKSSFLENFSS